MIGSFLTRGLVMVFGYAFPAYECYKTVEMNKPEIEHLRFWCQYWILVAVLTVFERVGDAFVSWVPMYSEAKLAFFIYLWYPKTKGTTYVYDSFFRPYVAKHETEIDRNLLELRTRVGDIAVLYWQRAASYGQTRVFEILQYVAAQSTPSPRPAQTQQGAVGRQKSSTSNGQQPPPATQPLTKEPPSPTSSTSSSGHNQDEVVAEEQTHPEVPGPPQTAAAIVSQKAVGKPPALLNSQKSVGKAPASLTSQKLVPKPPPKEIIIQPSPSEAEAMQIDLPSTLVNANPDQVPEESFLEETIRVTRARLRKHRTR